jgi:hypothetical protein
LAPGPRSGRGRRRPVRSPAPSVGTTETTTEWQSFWTSPLAAALLPVTDEPAVRRLFGLRHERERMMRGWTNPLYAQLASFDSEIRQLEDRIGLTPQVRLKLGISLGDAVRSLSEIAEVFPRGMFPGGHELRAQYPSGDLQRRCRSLQLDCQSLSSQPVLAPTGSDDIVGLSVYRRRSRAESTLIPHP